MTFEEYELHDRLDRLANADADRDVLVTRTVPPEESIGAARQPVETDYAEATQLDESTAPEPLTDALEATRQALNEYDEIPEDGLAIYAGVVDGDLLTATFDDLPAPIEAERYEHANEFDLDPLEGVTEPASTHGLLVVERGGAAIGRLTDEGVDPIDTFDSDVPGKSSAGGQSAERFERDRERQKREFFDEVAERAALEFLDDDPVDSVLFGGTTGTIERFRDEADLDHELEDRIVDTFAVEYASEQGLRQLARKGESALAERDRRDARETLSSFFDVVRDDDRPVAYGTDEVDDALEYDAVETLLLSTALEGRQLQRFGDRAVEQGGETVVVPDDFPGGDRFAEAFDGIGALLRFPIE
ncbi:Vms1/Ankzf1 family peptidyl-tRNA hydrolase [Halopiger goleimassiliensis]|uniref:Vms1/Ankzf1 family peptidyl-tRNA hydrolase n=1 Tax=Halopiger goleimassiliensis TaxID=1293048 RepID=UPI0006776A5A|nr:Vms1/Ankzf1 family peptidyl-tRNA hydrolase [Halopiger goleimassiliensis]